MCTSNRWPYVPTWAWGGVRAQVFAACCCNWYCIYRALTILVIGLSIFKEHSRKLDIKIVLQRAFSNIKHGSVLWKSAWKALTSIANNFGQWVFNRVRYIKAEIYSYTECGYTSVAITKRGWGKKGIRYSRKKKFLNRMRIWKLDEGREKMMSQSGLCRCMRRRKKEFELLNHHICLIISFKILFHTTNWSRSPLFFEFWRCART